MDSKPITPFVKGLKNYPTKYNKDVAEIRKWYDKQVHFPEIDNDFLLLFLHACYYNHEKTKKAIEHYFTIRANSPALFDDRDPLSDKIQNVFEYGNFASLPKKTSKGYNILLYSLHDTNSSRFVFAEGVKAFCMFNDFRLSEDGLSDGYIVLFDMKGCSVGHFARVTLPALRVYMSYIQDAHPARLKAIHIINTAAFINHVMRLITPLIQSELMNILKFHRELPSEEIIPLELYPSDYGGKAPPLRELHMESRKLMETYPYRDWLIRTSELKSDDTKRPKKRSTWGFFSGPDID